MRLVRDWKPNTGYDIVLFFQAEGGIRDTSVTGVQTCALPIWMREEAIVTAAAIASRDGGADLISTHGKWIRETFGRAFKGKNDPVHRTRAGLQFNPIAIAFVGTVLLLRNRFAMEDVHTLLDAAGDDNPAAAQGFVYVVAALAAIDSPLAPPCSPGSSPSRWASGAPRDATRGPIPLLKCHFQSYFLSQSCYWLL